MKKFFRKDNKGFTILELMVAITLFLVVIIYGISSLVSTTFSLNNSSKVVSIIDNLSFIMEDMARSIRTGDVYSCLISSSMPESCESGSLEFSFNESISGHRWGYELVETSNDPLEYNIKKYYDMGEEGVLLINSPEIKLKEGSGFFVYGAEPPASDNLRQPFVILRLIGEIKYKDKITPFNLQTSVSQMSLDLDYE